MIPQNLEELQKVLNLDPNELPEDPFQLGVLLRYAQDRLEKKGLDYFNTLEGQQNLRSGLDSLQNL